METFKVFRKFSLLDRKKAEPEEFTPFLWKWCFTSGK